MKIHIDSYIMCFCIQLLFITACSVTKLNKSELKVFRPGEIWADADSNHIQAHGGGIIKIKSA